MVGCLCIYQWLLSLSGTDQRRFTALNPKTKMKGWIMCITRYIPRKKRYYSPVYHHPVMSTSPSCPCRCRAASLISVSSCEFGSPPSIDSRLRDEKPLVPFIMDFCFLLLVPPFGGAAASASAATAAPDADFSPLSLARVAAACDLTCLKVVVLGTTSSRNSRLSLCETALAEGGGG